MSLVTKLNGSEPVDPNTHGWENLGTIDDHDLWYATLVDATWPLLLLDALPPKFICGLICRKDSIPSLDTIGFFRSLVAAGCRAIAIFADGDKRILEDAFDMVVIDAGAVAYEPTVWSTSHKSLYDMLAWVDYMGDYVPSAPIILLGLLDDAIATEVRAAMEDVVRLYNEDDDEESEDDDDKASDG